MSQAKGTGGNSRQSEQWKQNSGGEEWMGLSLPGDGDQNETEVGGSQCPQGPAKESVLPTRTHCGFQQEVRCVLQKASWLWVEKG